MRKIIVLIIMLAVVGALAGPLEESGITGGLAVVIGGDDTELIKNLGRNEKFLVQVLDTDSAKIEKPVNVRLFVESFAPTKTITV